MKFPKEKVFDSFIATKLISDLAKLDHEAVIKNEEFIRGVFGNSWPPKDLKLFETELSIKMHEAEFDAGKTFAYSILTPQKNKELGCIYFYPPENPNFDCVCFVWLIKTNIQNHENIKSELKNWIEKELGFSNPDYRKFW